MSRTKDERAPKVTQKRPKGAEEASVHAFAHRGDGALSQESLRKAPADRQAMARAIRAKVTRKSLGGWKPAKDRFDPVELLIETSKGRVDSLVPIRYGRMMASPFAFYAAPRPSWQPISPVRRAPAFTCRFAATAIW